MKKYLLRYLPLVLGVGAIVLLDQLTKTLVRTNLAYGASWSPWDWLEPFIRVVHTQNSGAAFSMLQGNNLLFMAMATTAAVVMVYYYPRIPAQEAFLRAPLILLLGGTLGNLTDRILYGEVTDFLYLAYFSVVNVADISITASVVVLVIVWYLQYRQEKNRVSPTLLL